MPWRAQHQQPPPVPLIDTLSCHVSRRPHHPCPTPLPVPCVLASRGCRACCITRSMACGCVGMPPPSFPLRFCPAQPAAWQPSLASPPPFSPYSPHFVHSSPPLCVRFSLAAPPCQFKRASHRTAFVSASTLCLASPAASARHCPSRTLPRVICSPRLPSRPPTLIPILCWLPAPTNDPPLRIRFAHSKSPNHALPFWGWAACRFEAATHAHTLPLSARNSSSALLHPLNAPCCPLFCARTVLARPWPLSFLRLILALTPTFLSNTAPAPLPCYYTTPFPDPPPCLPAQIMAAGIALVRVSSKPSALPLQRPALR